MPTLTLDLPITIAQLKELFRDYVLEHGTEEQLLSFKCDRDFKALIDGEVKC